MFTHLFRIALSCLLLSNTSAVLAQVQQDPARDPAPVEKRCGDPYACLEQEAASKWHEAPQWRQPGPTFETIRVASPASWDKDCVPDPVPGVTVITKPEHGYIELREATVRPIRVQKGNVKCIGTDQRARVVNYVPTGRPVESDQVSLSILNVRGERYEIDCTVRIAERKSECKMRK